MQDGTEEVRDNALPDAVREGHASDLPDPPHREPSAAGDIFIGRDGLRAGWSLLLYCILLIVLFSVSGFLVQRLGLGGTTATKSAASNGSATVPATPVTLIPPKALVANEGLPLLCVLAATWLMAKIERRPFFVFGLDSRGWLRRFLTGLGWGATLLSLLVGSLRAAGLLVFDGRLLSAQSGVRYGVIWLAGFLMIGLFEECLFRGYLQITLARGLSGLFGWLGMMKSDALGFGTAAVLLSFGFGLTHQSNKGESPIGLLAAGLVGVIFCLSLWRTGSLWWAIGFHAAWDWAQSFLYGVADSGMMVEGHLLGTHPQGRVLLSGGLTGPEGSVLILPILVLITVVILLTLRDHRVSNRTTPTEMHLDLR